MLKDYEKPEQYVKMAQFGYKQYTHAFFNSREYKRLRAILFDKIEKHNMSNTELPLCNVAEIKKAGKYVITKHTNGVDLTILYTNQDALLSYVIQKFGKEPKKEDYDIICSYIKDNCEHIKVTDIPFSISIEENMNGYYGANYFYDPDVVNLSFYKKLPTICCGISLEGPCNASMKISYVHEMYHALINRNKGIVRNNLNDEVLSIFMELVASIDIDKTGLLTNQTYLERIIELKARMLDLLTNTFYDQDGIDCVEDQMYILSILEALALFDTYVDGEETIRKEIDKSVNRVITGKVELEDILDKYEAVPEKGSSIVKQYVKKIK